MVLITITGYVAAIGSVYCATMVSEVCANTKNDCIVGMIVCATAAIICSIILI